MASKVTVHNEPQDLRGKVIGGGVKATTSTPKSDSTTPSGGENVFNGPVSR